MIRHNYRILLLLLIHLFSNASFSQENIHDTIVLRHGSADGQRSKVFIEPNRNSKLYNLLSNFDFDKKFFSEMAKTLEDSAGKKSKTNKLRSLPKKWVPLQLYNGRYYVYIPCDGIYNYKILITDEYICHSEVGALFPRELNYLRKINKKSYRNSERDYWWREKDLTIDIIDKKKGIAVFSTVSIDDNTIHYRLMVDANKIRLFPLIKNFCRGGKDDEFDFNEPDFKKLLHQK